MFKFTSDQIDRYAAATDESRSRRALWAASQRWQEPFDAVLNQFAHSAARGQAFGFLTDADLGDYLDLVHGHGDDFDTQPWAAPFFIKLPLDYPTGTALPEGIREARGPRWLTRSPAARLARSRRSMA